MNAFTKYGCRFKITVRFKRSHESKSIGLNRHLTGVLASQETVTGAAGATTKKQDDDNEFRNFTLGNGSTREKQSRLDSVVS